MNNAGVLTTSQEYFEFKLNEYVLLRKEGEFIVTLKYRYWGKQLNLGCYFLSSDGEKFFLYAWRRKLINGEHYCPRISNLGFENVEDNTKWIITARKNKNGNVVWLDAKEIN